MCCRLLPHSHQGKKLFKNRRITLLVINICDVLSSRVSFLGTWLIPARGLEGHFGPVYGVAGTNATCSYGNFFNQFGVMASPLYNLALTMYYLLKIRYNWTGVSLDKTEPILLCFRQHLCGSVFWLDFLDQPC
jgi:hypothetical protein